MSFKLGISGPVFQDTSPFRNGLE
uniref:Uncharacterized protein n=1 Tax=Rhizophora mucronata TaxID=61149 RepID=A0A2P2NBB6_RHIMU